MTTDSRKKFLMDGGGGDRSSSGDLPPSVALLSCRGRSYSLGQRLSLPSNASHSTARKALAIVDPVSRMLQEIHQLTVGGRGGGGGGEGQIHRPLKEDASVEFAPSSSSCGPTPSTSANRGAAMRIRFNVSGQHFDIRPEVLARHPDTLLGDPEKRRRFYDRRRDEFFFDRHRPSFEAIFAYLMYGGKPKRPSHVPDEIFLAEMLFYQLEKRIVDEYKHSEGYSEDALCLPDNEVRQLLWKLFEYPKSSPLALIVALVSVSMTMAAIVLLCLETLPSFKGKDCLHNRTGPNWSSPFFVIESICNAWFIVELAVRFLSCPSKLLFWKDVKNVIDVLAILPYVIAVTSMLLAGGDYCAKGVDSSAAPALAFLRVIRLVRIFKLTKHSIGLQVLILTFRASIEGLSMFLVALVVSMLVYSSAIYYAELNVTDSQIESIPDAFWWAIITMTTVGYGDKVPLGTLGRVIGAACAISGILTLAIPVPIIAGHFNKFYRRKTGRVRLHLG